MSEEAGADEVSASALRGVWLLIGRHVGVLAMSAVGTTILLRSVAPSTWGSYATSYFVLAGVDALLTTGLLVELLRGPRAPSAERLARAQALSWIAGLVLAVLTVAGAALLRTRYPGPDLLLLGGATAVCVVLYAARAVPLLSLERRLRYRPVATAELADMAAFYAVALGGVALDHPATGLAFATVARGVASVLVLRRAAPEAPWAGRQPLDAARDFLPRGLPLAAVALISLLDGLVPALALGDRTRDVGFFVTGSALLGYALAGATAAQRVAVPGLASVAAETRGRLLAPALDTVTTATALVLVALAGLSGVWLVPLLGDAWRDADRWLTLLGIALVVAAPRGLLVAALTQAGHASLVLRAQALATFGYLAAALVAVAIAGPLGAAAAYVVSRWLWSLAVAVLAVRRIGAHVSSRTWSVPGLGAAAIAALATLAGDHPAAAVAAAIGLLAAGVAASRTQLAGLVTAARGVRSRRALRGG